MKPKKKVQKTAAKIRVEAGRVLIPNSLLPYKTLASLTSFDAEPSPIVLAQRRGSDTEIPRFFFSPKQLMELGPVHHIEDLRDSRFSSSVKMSLKPGISIRKNQEDAWESLKQAESGILNLACGKGKTFLALNKVCHERKKTLIVAPQVAHLKNWEAELKKFFNFTGKIGWIRGPKMEGGDIIFATVQTLAKRREECKDFLLKNNVSQVIYDECHCMSARYFSQAADIVSGIRIGLSATPNRKDRNEGIFSAFVGKVFYSDTTQQLVPTVYIKETLIDEYDASQNIGGDVHIATLRNYLVEHPVRNKLILDLVNLKLAEGRTVYILSHSVQHVEWLSKQLPGSTYIHGGVVADKRIGLLNSGNPVVATIAIGREAYNRADLDTLFIVTPFAADSHSAITLEQSVGRILRAHPNKKDPEVFFFRDPNVNGMLSGMLRSVIRESKKRGYKVVDETVNIRRNHFN